MAVNHFLMSNEQLLNELIDLTVQHTYVNHKKYEDYWEDNIDYIECKVYDQKEYWDIRKEILERMKR